MVNLKRFLLFWFIHTSAAVNRSARSTYDSRTSPSRSWKVTTHSSRFTPTTAVSNLLTTVPTTYNKHATTVPTKYSNHATTVPTKYSERVTTLPTTYSKHVITVPTKYSKLVTTVPTTYSKHVTTVPTKYSKHVTTVPATYSEHVTTVPATYSEHVISVNPSVGRSFQTVISSPSSDYTVPITRRSEKSARSNAPSSPSYTEMTKNHSTDNTPTVIYSLKSLMSSLPNTHTSISHSSRGISESLRTPTNNNSTPGQHTEGLQTPVSGDTSMDTWGTSVINSGSPKSSTPVDSTVTTQAETILTVATKSVQLPEVTTPKETSHFGLAKKNIKYVALGASWGFILIVFVIIAVVVRRQRNAKRKMVVLDDKDPETLGASFHMMDAEALVLGEKITSRNYEGISSKSSELSESESDHQTND